VALTPRIVLRQSQTLVMTPQLQQSIKLLQMSSTELAAYVAAEVERNPVLELRAPRPGPTGPPRPSGAGPVEDPVLRIAAETTLWEHLHRQIRSHRLDARDAEAALLVADELEEDGYLRIGLDEVAARHLLSDARAARALAIVQSCDPAGVGARSLAECLALQLRERDRLDPAMEAMLGHLDLAARGRTRELERICGVDAEDIADMLAELRSLDPKPGQRFATTPVQAATPDIFVGRRGDGGLVVELNSETLPHVLIDNLYVAELASGDESARAFVSECRSNAGWLVRALEQRARTILKVATEIALRQERFFDDGIGALRPLTQRAVADAIGMHESTVSRVAAGKYLGCAQGNFELRSFFSSAIQSVDGDEAFSAAAVQSRIRALIDAEPRGRPLSDDRLVTALAGEGIDIARRTVAKYRDVMGLPSSVERRRRKASLSRI
jgi:RNA polymerase sigma-54 factor